MCLSQRFSNIQIPFYSIALKSYLSEYSSVYTRTRTYQRIQRPSRKRFLNVAKHHALFQWLPSRTARLRRHYLLLLLFFLDFRGNFEGPLSAES
jgi:hypothetical protein